MRSNSVRTAFRSGAVFFLHLFLFLASRLLGFLHLHSCTLHFLSSRWLFGFLRFYRFPRLLGWFLRLFNSFLFLNFSKAGGFCSLSLVPAAFRNISAVAA